MARVALLTLVAAAPARALPEPPIPLERPTEVLPEVPNAWEQQNRESRLGVMRARRARRELREPFIGFRHNRVWLQTGPWFSLDSYINYVDLDEESVRVWGTFNSYVYFGEEYAFRVNAELRRAMMTVDGEIDWGTTIVRGYWIWNY